MLCKQHWLSRIFLCVEQISKKISNCNKCSKCFAVQRKCYIFLRFLESLDLFFWIQRCSNYCCCVLFAFQNLFYFFGGQKNFNHCILYFNYFHYVLWAGKKNNIKIYLILNLYTCLFESLNYEHKFSTSHTNNILRIKVCSFIKGKIIIGTCHSPLIT